ncbi:hypothetical protein HY374_00950 [Candidatus Berkelbacteria bacterium]|nr:hypothetical protein [Candidatus Berkelbacteria bacterium]
MLYQQHRRLVRRQRIMRGLARLVVYGLLAALIPLALEWLLWLRDPLRGLDQPGHSLRPKLQYVVGSCLDVDGARAWEYVSEAFTVSRIERAATPFRDRAKLVELTGFPNTYGPFQIHWATARDTYREHRCPALDQLLELSPSQGDELMVSVDKSEIIRGLQLRGKGSAVLAVLHTVDLKRWIAANKQVTPERVVEETQAAIRACGRHYRYGTGPVEEVRWFVNQQRQARLFVFVMNDYAVGPGASMGADLQTMLNESRVIWGLKPPLVADGDPGPATRKLAALFLGGPVPAGEGLARFHQRVRARWQEQVEPILLERIAQAAARGDGAELATYLQLRYAGHSALYTGLAEFCRKAIEANPKAGDRASNRVNRAWEDWANGRKGELWRFLTDEELFERTFRPDETRLEHETLVQLVAQVYLLQRLASRELDAEVVLRYEGRLVAQDINPMGRILLLARERGWLIGQ